MQELTIHKSWALRYAHSGADKRDQFEICSTTFHVIFLSRAIKETDSVRIGADQALHVVQQNEGAGAHATVAASRYSFDGTLNGADNPAVAIYVNPACRWCIRLRSA